MKRSTLILLLLGGAVAAAITWQALQPPEPIRVVTAKVERAPNLRSIVSATGEIRAKEFVDIQAEVAGVITELHVREGDQVKQGDVLLRLEDLQLKAEEDSARAQVGASEADARSSEVGVATAEANLAAERTALANAKLEAEQAITSRDRAKASFQRKQELHTQNLIGGEEYEIAAAEARLASQRLDWNMARIQQADANITAALTRVEAAKAMRDAACRRLDATKAALARAVDMAGKTVLKSPLTGLITKLNVERGERAVPGIQSNPQATLMTIADMSVIEAEIRVAEADIVLVALGAEASVEVDAMRDVEIAGKVTEIGQSPIQNANSSGNSQSQDGKEFKVVVRLTAPPAALRPGFTATAEIVTATRKDVLVMPFQAQTAREVDTDEKGNYLPPPAPKEGEEHAEPKVLSAAERARRKELKGVFVRRDGKARFQPAQIGVIGDTMDVEVLSGLQEGDEVISGPFQVLRTLKEWDRIELDEERMSGRGSGGKQ
jgi:HlyD family secretion protein